jgi:hypothetical protein
MAGHVQEQGVSRRKSAAYVEYVSILRRLTTQLLGVRCIFEIGSNDYTAMEIKNGRNGIFL